MELTYLLNKYGQAHLLRAAELLPPEQREKYLSDLGKIDYEYISHLFSQDIPAELVKEVTPAPAEELSLERRNEARLAGLGLIAEGKVAALTMAGGQGTRLGYAGPKGCFDIGCGVSLFGLQARRLLALGRSCCVSIPWYVMTSEENDDATREFFRANGWFGLNPADVFFFMQGMLPVVDTEGKILLSAPGQLSLGPDGNGGVFAALPRSGALADMERRGVEMLFICGIDNALAQICDPVFLGFAELSGAPCASKSVTKVSPDERVGVFCLRGGRPGVVEYSELSDDMRTARDADGGLLYGDSNIVAHAMRTEALKSICGRGLPMHRAYKAITHIDEAGALIRPEKPNAWKFEAFIFDAFAAFDRMAILRVERAKEFAPVKNASGADSPATALELLRGTREV